MPNPDKPVSRFVSHMAKSKATSQTVTAQTLDASRMGELPALPSDILTVSGGDLTGVKAGLTPYTRAVTLPSRCPSGRGPV